MTKILIDKETVNRVLACAERCESLDGKYSWADIPYLMQQALEQSTEQEPVRLQCVVCETVYADGVLPQTKEASPRKPLTDEEINQGLLRTNYAMQTAGAWRDGVEWAQSQLKEKNHDRS